MLPLCHDHYFCGGCRGQQGEPFQFFLAADHASNQGSGQVAPVLRTGVSSPRLTCLVVSRASSFLPCQARHRHARGTSSRPSSSFPFPHSGAVFAQVLGFHRLHEYKFDSFSLFFLYMPSPEEKPGLPPSGSKESEKVLWSMKGTVLELTW